MERPFAYSALSQPHLPSHGHVLSLGFSRALLLASTALGVSGAVRARCRRRSGRVLSRARSLAAPQLLRVRKRRDTDGRLLKAHPRVCLLATSLLLCCQDHTIWATEPRACAWRAGPRRLCRTLARCRRTLVRGM
jgi:hypothetical protein